ncbi:MAG: hypothetical protein ACRCZF_08490, partial [Gemmataceae bacterium]
MKTRLQFQRLDDRITPAALDPTYGVAGTGTLQLETNLSFFYPLTDTQADGSVVTAAVAQDGQIQVSRLLPNGQPDTTFAGDGRAEIQFPGFPSKSVVTPFAPDSMTIAPDGSILLAGFFTPTDQSPFGTAGIVRLTANGQLDTRFDGDGVRLLGTTPAESALKQVSIRNVIAANDGSILVAGTSQQLRILTNEELQTGVLPPIEPAIERLVRLLPNGSLDTSFGAQGTVTLPTVGDPSITADGYRVLLAADGSTFVVRNAGRFSAPTGEFNFSYSISDTAVTRLRANGSVDTSYGKNGTTLLSAEAGRSLRLNEATLLNDNRVVVVMTDQGDGYLADSTLSIIRLTPTGQLDTTYDGDGGVLVPSSYLGTQRDTLIRPDGSAIIAFTGIAPVQGDILGAELVSLKPDGSRDTSFGTNGLAFVDVSKVGASRSFVAKGIEELSDGRIALGTPFPGMSSLPDGQVQIAAIDLTAPGMPLPTINDDVLKSQAEQARISVFGYQNIFPEEVNKNTNTIVTDVNGDGINDTVFAAGEGNKPYLRIRDGRTGNDLLPATLAYEETFRGGVLVDAVDVNGDGKKEIITSPGMGGGARIQVFGISEQKLQTLNNFFAIEDSQFRGGARIATGDVNGDGKMDLIVGAGDGGGPRVAVYSGNDLTKTMGNPPKLVNDFFAFGGSDVQNLRNGVYVAAGDLNDDGRADLIFGGGPGGGPRVMAVSGADLFRGGPSVALAQPLANFFAGDSNLRDGVPIRVRQQSTAGGAELVAGTGDAEKVFA